VGNEQLDKAWEQYKSNTAIPTGMEQIQKQAFTAGWIARAPQTNGEYRETTAKDE